MTLLAGRVAAVIGAAQGIGFAVAEQFVAQGLSSYMTGTVLEVTGGRHL